MDRLRTTGMSPDLKSSQFASAPRARTTTPNFLESLVLTTVIIPLTASTTAWSDPSRSTSTNTSRELGTENALDDRVSTVSIAVGDSVVGFRSSHTPATAKIAVVNTASVDTNQNGRPPRNILILALIQLRRHFPKGGYDGINAKERDVHAVRRSFTDEFKAGAVRLVIDEGKSVGQAARELDLTESALRMWVERARADRGTGSPACSRRRSARSWGGCGRRIARSGWSATS